MSAQPEQYVLAAWKLPLIIAAIACSIVVGFYLGGPGLGMAVGALAASAVVVMAIRNPPKPAIVPPAAGDGRARLLLLVDGPTGVAAITAFATAAFAELGGAGAVEVLAVVPLRQRPLDRWTGDSGEARKLAAGRLAMVVSALRRAGLPASGCLGDEQPVQAAEDALRGFPATRVAMISAGERAAAAAELASRLSVPFSHLRGGPAPAEDPALLPPDPGPTALRSG